MGNDILAVDVRRRPRQTGFYGWVQRWVVWAMFAISQQRSVKIDRVGGEGGIRTLGPPQGGQRFSRPPRSTAPAPLRAQLYRAGKPPLRSWEGADTSRTLTASQPRPDQR